MTSHFLYTAVAGRNPGVFVPQHVWIARLTDEAGMLLWSNDITEPAFEVGTAEKGHYLAVAAALSHVSPGSHLVLIAKEKSTLWYPFSEGLEGPKRYHHRKPNGQLFKASDLIRPIDEAALAKGVSIGCRPPASGDESELLAQAGDDVRARKEAAEEILSAPDTKFSR